MEQAGNKIYVAAYTTSQDYGAFHNVALPIESFITYCAFKYCAPDDIHLYFSYVHKEDEKQTSISLSADDLVFLVGDIPWPVECKLPVALLLDKRIITGLCSVARLLCQHRTSHQSPEEHEEGLLGFRKSCLQAPNVVSIWTRFCEVDLINTLNILLSMNVVLELPKSLVRFENHLKQPVRVHNIYKIAREIKKKSKAAILNEKEFKIRDPNQVLERIPKVRKWKSNVKKECEIDCSTKIEDLNINHKFAEGPFFTLADLILLPSYHIIVKSFGTMFEPLLPLTYKWYSSVMNITEVQCLKDVLHNIKIEPISIEDVVVPSTDNVSLYKRDPKRQNPKKRLFTKEEDIERDLKTFTEKIHLNVCSNSLDFEINWDEVPDGANPRAGHLPDDRIERKTLQLENLAVAVMSIAQEGDVIVDFCSGSGHLGILIAYLLPKCTIILLENKEQSLMRAHQKVHDMGLQNVYLFQGNLDFFIGKFDIGVALHACGTASDMVLDKCLKVNAKFVLCPCCYGSIQPSGKLVYPRSSEFRTFNVDQYLHISHAADQTHDDHPLTARGEKCMALIDTDRASLASEFGYSVTLTRLKPLSCTPKNNLLIGVPS